MTRQTAVVDGRSGKPLLIRLDAGGKTVTLWVKGTRAKYSVAVDRVWRAALQDVLEAIRQRKQAGKKVLVDRGKIKPGR